MANLPVKDGFAGLVYLDATGSGTDGDPYSQIHTMVGVTSSVTVTPTLTVAGLYASGDYVGTSATAMDFTPMARAAEGSGLVMGAMLVDDSAQTVPCELWLFHTTPAGLPADNAAFTITDADALTCIGVIEFNTYYASALNSVSEGDIRNGQAPFACDAGDQSIFGVLVSRGAPTYADGELHVTLLIAQD
jgi:hypothetical protein